jgi:hypothetical protein
MREQKGLNGNLDRTFIHLHPVSAEYVCVLEV